MKEDIRKRVSVVICAKNEEQSIGQIIEHTKPYSTEIIVVDGNSSDKTVQIAKSLGSKVIRDSGKGKGDGIKAGIREASKEIIVFMDADGSHNPDDIPKLIAPILRDEAEHVTGSRSLGGSEELHGTLENCLRMIGSAIITLGINYRFKILLSDSQNGFRAMKTALAKRLNLKESLTTIEQEMIIKTLHGGYRIKEVPTHEYHRKYGKSHINLRRVGLRYIYAWIKYLFFCNKKKAIKNEAFLVNQT